jgi:hypothetical protein
MKAAVFFLKMLVPIYQTIWRYIPEDSDLDAHQRENLKYHNIFFFQILYISLIKGLI